MEILTSRNAVVRAVSQSGLIQKEPFVLVDVGCSFGVDPAWRAFAPSLRAYGFDPNVSEINRLVAHEVDPHVNYVAAYVGLRSDHPFMTARSGEGWWGNNPWDRLAVSVALARRQSQTGLYSRSDLRRANIWSDDEQAVGERIELPTWLAANAVRSFDFLKLDTDGEDLAVLSSLKGRFRDLAVIGVGVEVNFYGTDSSTDHTFHNVDRLMREEGFELFDLTLRRYANAALPSRFVTSAPAQSSCGRIYQGDALYLRDMAAPQHADEAATWTPAQLAKLACLFDMFALPDCSAEILLRFRRQLEPALGVDALLDKLVPRRFGRQLSYHTYIDKFAQDGRMFYRSLLSRLLTSRQVRRRALAIAADRIPTLPRWWRRDTSV